MPFYEELSLIVTRHTCSITGDLEEPPPEEEGVPGTMEQLGAQEQVNRGYRARAQLLDHSSDMSQHPS